MNAKNIDYFLTLIIKSNITKEIEKEKEEITNLNFYLKQIMSVMSTLNSDNQKLTELLEKMKLDFEQQCNNLNEKIVQNEGLIFFFCLNR